MAISIGTATSAAAQVTTDIPFDAEAYGQLDRLRGLGVVDPYFESHRQISRLHLQRLIAAGWTKLGTMQATSRRRSAGARILGELSRRYGIEIPSWIEVGGDDRLRIEGPPARVDGVRAGVSFVSSPPRSVPGAGMTAIDAVINPLVDGQGGRLIGDGSTAAVELAASAEFGSYVAAVASPRVVAVDGRGATARGEIDFTALNVTVGAGNARVTAGRVPVGYGQGIHGGLLASRNAPALDMIQLRSDQPARLPGFLRRLGPVSGALFVADLGPRQNFPHSKLAAWKVSAMPSASIQMGISVATHTGGSGAPAASFGERIVDLLPLIDVLLYQDRDLLFSNKLAGVDVRWRHAGSGAELYLDMMLDDFDVRRVRSALWEDAGYIAGVSLPAVGNEGQFRFDAEYQHTGLRFYEHVQFTSGVTSSRRIIGLPLGPQGNSVVSSATWTTASGARISLLAAGERRSGDQWVTRVTGPDDSGWQFIRSEDRPEELRVRSIVEWGMPLPRYGARVEVRAGVERTRNHAFSAGASRTNALASMSLIAGF